MLNTYEIATIDGDTGDGVAVRVGGDDLAVDHTGGRVRVTDDRGADLRR